MTTKLTRLVPLSGIAFVLAMIGVISQEGEELPDGATSQEVLAHWAARTDGRLVVTTLAAFAALFLVAFSASLRSALRAHEPAEASASAVAYAGGVIAAVGIVVSGMVQLAASRAGGDGAAEVVLPLDHLAQSTWVPVTAGLGVLLLATGAGAIHSGALPKVLAWPAVLLGLLLLTPGGIVAFMLSPLWFLAASIVLFRRTSRSTPAQEPGSYAVASR